MDYDNEELLDIAYQLLVVDDETAEIIKDTLNDHQLNIVIRYQEEIKLRWEYKI